MNEQFQQNNNFQYYNMQRPPKKPIGLALTSFVLSLLTVLLSCCSLYSAVGVFLAAVSLVSLILGCIALFSPKNGGKVLAVFSVIISFFMMIAFILSFTLFKGINEDMMQFANHQNEYIAEFDETGEVPEEFSEYSDPKYDWLWQAMGLESFSQFYAAYIEQVKQSSSFGFSYSYSYGNNDNSSSESSDESSQETTTLPDDFGEEPINI